MRFSEQLRHAVATTPTMEEIRLRQMVPVIGDNLVQRISSNHRQSTMEHHEILAGVRAGNTRMINIHAALDDIVSGRVSFSIRCPLEWPVEWQRRANRSCNGNCNIIISSGRAPTRPPPSPPNRARTRSCHSGGIRDNASTVVQPISNDFDTYDFDSA